MFHDKAILKKSFTSDQKVILYDSRLYLFPGKLRSRWTGPFVVRVVFPHGEVEIEDSKNVVFKVNGQRLKPFLKMPVSDNEKIMSLQEPQYAG